MLGIHLRCNCGVHWWTIFRPHPAALIPEVLAPFWKCGRLGMALLRFTSSFWWSWGECQVVGRGECHSTRCCEPGLWWSGIKYSQRHVCQWGGAGTVVAKLWLLRSACIAWDEDGFTPVTWRRCFPCWVMQGRWWWQVDGIALGVWEMKESVGTSLSYYLVMLQVDLKQELALDVGWRQLGRWC